MISPSETQALRDLQRIASSLNIPVMLIGAGARLFMLDWKYNLASSRTTKDLRDVEFILKNYLQDQEENRIFEELSEQLANGEIEYQHAGPFLLGKDAGQLCNRQTIERLLPILDALVNPYSEKIGQLVGPIGDVDEEEKRHREIIANFKSFQDGIKQIEKARL